MVWSVDNLEQLGIAASGDFSDQILPLSSLTTKDNEL